MSARPSTTQSFSPAIVRAFADALENGFVGSLADFANSDAGQTAAKAMQDQKDAELRSVRMGAARAVAKDLRINGKVTKYSGDRAKSLLSFLSTVDFENLEESLPMPKRGGKDADEVPEAAEVTPSAE